MLTRRGTAAITLIVVLALIAMLMLPAAAVAIQVEKPLIRDISQLPAATSQVQEIGKQLMQTRAAGKRHTTLIFAGPNGAEKLPAAETLGRQLSRPVQRVALAALVSKYAGETEKNLNLLLAKAGLQNVILFFEDADDLFGKRTAATDPHGRYANQETSALLQRIEAYEGVAILASNRPETPQKIRHDHLIEFAPRIKKTCPPDCPQGIMQ